MKISIYVFFTLSVPKNITLMYFMSSCRKTPINAVPPQTKVFSLQTRIDDFIVISGTGRSMWRWSSERFGGLWRGPNVQVGWSMLRLFNNVDGLLSQDIGSTIEFLIIDLWHRCHHALVLTSILLERTDVSTYYPK